MSLGEGGGSRPGETWQRRCGDLMCVPFGLWPENGKVSESICGGTTNEPRKTPQLQIYVLTYARYLLHQTTHPQPKQDSQKTTQKTLAESQSTPPSRSSNIMSAPSEQMQRSCSSKSSGCSGARPNSDSGKNRPHPSQGFRAWRVVRLPVVVCCVCGTGTA